MTRFHLCEEQSNVAFSTSRPPLLNCCYETIWNTEGVTLSASLPGQGTFPTYADTGKPTRFAV